MRSGAYCHPQNTGGGRVPVARPNGMPRAEWEWANGCARFRRESASIFPDPLAPPASLRTIGLSSPTKATAFRIILWHC